MLDKTLKKKSIQKKKVGRGPFLFFMASRHIFKDNQLGYVFAEIVKIYPFFPFQKNNYDINNYKNNKKNINK